MNVAHFHHDLGMTGGTAFISTPVWEHDNRISLRIPYPWKTEIFSVGDIELVVTRHIKHVDGVSMALELANAKSKEEEVQILRSIYFNRKYKATERVTGMAAGLRKACKASEVEYDYRDWLLAKVQGTTKSPAELLEEVTDRAINKYTFVDIANVVFKLRQMRFANRNMNVITAIDEVLEDEQRGAQ